MSLLKSLCSPSSVALIGVSRRTETLNPLKILIDFGYKGKIYPVNPSAEEILGYKCYRKVEEIPDIPELAVIMVRREIVPDILKQCAKKGIKISVIISDGFAESDEKGKRLQKELEDISKEYGIRILGPNSMGVVNYFSHFTTSFVFVSSKVMPVSFIGQSGLFVQGFSSLPIGKAIDIGNGCDIDFPELLSELLEDDQTQLIAVHIEELKEPELFKKVIKEKGHKKPIVIFKSGREEKAKKAVVSHSGAIAKDYKVYKAFFFSLGLILTDSTEKLEDVIYMLSKKIHIPDKKRVGIITPSGGAGIICLDSLEKYGFELSELSESTLRRISQIYPPYYSPSNPVDIMSASFRHGYKKVYTEALNCMIEDDSVDIIFCINGIPTLKTISSVVKERSVKKPVLSWVIGYYNEEDAENFTKDSPVAVFKHPDRAFCSLGLCMEYKAIREMAKKEPDIYEIKKEEKIREIIENSKGKDYLFSDAFEIIKAAGIPVAETVKIKDESELRDAFERLRPPVCIKAEAEGGIHKKKKGLIKVWIKSYRELFEAYKEMIKKDVRAVLVQKMIEEGEEIFIGVKKDEKFGHILLVGKGGEDVELYGDIEEILVPFNRDQAYYVFRKTKVSDNLKETEIQKVVELMIKVSSLCIRFPEIKEMDLNPVILNPYGIWVVDAKIII